jgi:lipopolysaccharide transport system permease protein
MLGKVYFPRLIFPVIPILAHLVDFAISMLIILGVSLYYRVIPTWNLVFLPLFVVLMMITALGIGMWSSAMAIRFRDVKLAMPFVIRMLMYTAPIVYSASSLSETSRLIYSLNPLVSIIEGFRACLLGTPLEWHFLYPGMFTTLIIFVSGAFYFQRMERVFVDVI